MPPRKLAIFTLLLLVPALLALAACGGDDDDDSSFQPGRLTDPEEAPTSTPWDAAPEIVILDPDNIQPLPPDNPGPEPSATEVPEPGEPGVCGDTYTVEAGDTMFGIAEKCGVDPQDIIDLNPEADPQALSIGEVLNMPAADSGEDDTEGDEETG